MPQSITPLFRGKGGVMSNDPGPLARFLAVKAKPDTPSIVFQRLVGVRDGDAGETLAEIAQSWGLPRTLFIEWFMTEHRTRYDAAMAVKEDRAEKIRDQLRMESIAFVLAQVQLLRRSRFLNESSSKKIIELLQAPNLVPVQTTEPARGENII